ncbi:helicase-related protein [Pseudoalteromonas sp. Of7M-16]|uniref:helicase-related protein n=1 Tax=Pseudoalteromonas sp. Of7M-16 TaxID=2917756 RepID=UPI001EF59759|nr:helicase-related protein [Pseudoalteromonas sp. Of7M-16]MCG7550918.1 SNF2-related protein [Pseudoalteromonas sp. Of7M-16]
MRLDLSDVAIGVMSAIEQSATASELSELILNLDNNEHVVNYGLEKGTKTKRLAANKSAREVLDRVGDDHTLLTEEDREVLKRYSGKGGIGGSVHEYYTPEWLASSIWDAMAVNGFDGGVTGEPSAGAGVFNGTKPRNTNITASEMDATSSQINQLLHPEDKIFNKTFEQLTQIATEGMFDAFTGNVPFGDKRPTAYADPEYQDIEELERYFITRMIDMVKHNGLICCVVPTQIINRKSWSNWREDISRKAEFLGAHRLPSGVFKNNGTDVVTDVIVLKKHSEELLETIANLPDKTLEEANVLYAPFITGKWFQTSEGKKFIHGTVDKVKNQFGGFSETVKANGTINQKAIQAKLARRFDSRIDYDLVNVAKPVIRLHVEGDRKKINGRWHEYMDGQWQLQQRNSVTSDIDKSVYGVASVQEASAVIAGGPEEILKLDFSQFEKLAEDFEYLFHNSDSARRTLDLYKFAIAQNPKHHTRIFRGALIGELITDLSNISTQMRSVPPAQAARLRELVSAEIERHGIAAKEPFALLTGRNANAWNAFASATDTKGDFSDLLKGTLDVSETVEFQTDDAQQVITHLHARYDLNPVPFEEFERLYTGPDKPKSLTDVAKMDGIAITPDGNLMPMDRATSGNVVKTVAQIKEAMSQASDPHIIANYERQLKQIEAKRKRNTDKEIEFSLNAKWFSRKYVLEFLQENGYEDFSYIKTQEDESGESYINDEYEGQDGIFAGYTMHKNGQKRPTNQKIAFERQLENHLNGVSVRSKNKSAAARYKERIKVVERQFADWMRQHDDIDDIVDSYNDIHNGYIAFEHSEHDLGLKNVSGDIKLLSYQNSAIRRASEDGRGIVGFGTGLGKTLTAYGLISFNTEMGRSKRTAVVIPKAVLENWYHEAKAFYGKNGMEKVLFPAIEIIRDDNGEVVQETVLDEHGEPKINEVNGQVIKRDKIKVITDAKTIKKQLQKIPHSNYQTVILTKEQFSKLPMRPESVEAHVMERVSVGALKGKYETAAKNYKEAQKNENFKAKYADVGTKKYDDVPYFEDMGFDTIVADEGHNYRNSYAAGFKSSKLAYLPTAPSSDVAVDMALKSEYLRRKNGGRGTYLLTATPTVNSPTDIYNMLSLILSPEEWMQLGIVDVDDFIEQYGETAIEQITKLSGEVEEQEALVGFKNLTALRSLFHRWVNLKDIKDVNNTVKIPKLEEHQVDVDLSEEQQNIYEELRERADQLNEEVIQKTIELPDGEEMLVDVPNGDTIFGIIRDMDRVATDLDLYNKTMTFVLPAKNLDAVKQAVETLPDTLVIKETKAGKDDELSQKEALKVEVAHRAKITENGETITLVVHEAYEALMIKALSKFDVKEEEITHPISPKYAALIENIRTGLKEGKQIVFTEEKTQHNKLRRLLSHQLDMKLSEIGIINADTVAGKSKADDQEAGLEAIAKAYNEGKTKIVIANKKAEVGINLHHGTAATHHLTLPWTPASIKQRNGRGARVGSKSDKMKVYYYCGSGSFDEFRLKALKRKAGWMDEIFKSDKEKMENGDAVASAEEMSLLLAANPEERAARDAKAKRIKEAKIKTEKKRIATVDVANFIKASHDAQWSEESLTEQLKTLQAKRVELKHQDSELEQKLRSMNSYYASASDIAKYKSDRAQIASELKQIATQVKSLSQVQGRLKKSLSKFKQLKPQVEQAIKDGLVSGADETLLTEAHKMMLHNGRVIKEGDIYEHKEVTGSTRNPYIYNRLLEVQSIDLNLKQVTTTVLFSDKSWGSATVGGSFTVPVDELGKLTSYTKSEAEIKQKLLNNLDYSEIQKTLNREQYYQFLKSDELKFKDSILKRTENGFVIESGPNYNRSDSDTFIYPDNTDKTLLKEVAQWLLSDRESLNRYGLRDLLTHLYGAGFVSTVESYGTQATEKQISDWVQKHVSELLTNESFLAELTGTSEWLLKREFERNLEDIKTPEGVDNVSAFKKAMAKRIDTEVAKALARNQSEEERKNTLRKQRVSIFYAQDLETALPRLEALVSDAVWSMNEDDRYKLMKPETALSAYKGLDEDDLIAALYSDIKRLDIRSTYSDIQASVKQAFQFVRSYQTDEFKRTLERLKRENAPQPPAEQEKAQEAKDTIESTGDDGTINGVTVLTNYKEIHIKGSRRFKGVTYETGEVWCLHDPAGFDGALYENREEMKELAGKGNYKYAKDASADYPDSWWFIRKEAVTKAQLMELFGE